MTNEQYVKASLATLAWSEAHHHGGVNNMLAIAFIIRSRVYAGWGTWSEVISKHYLWSANTPTLEPLIPIIDLKAPEARMLLQAIDGIVDGGTPDTLTSSLPYDQHGKKAPPTPALYYAELNNISREWFKEKIVQDRDNHPIIGQVGSVTLFA